MKTITDKEMERSISAMLLFGVSLSALLVAIGGALYLRHPSVMVPDYRQFVAEREPLQGIVSTLRGASHFDPKSVVEFGILVLISTPILRVAWCVVGFARQKDPMYVLISTSVFAILIYSLIQGGR